MNLYVSNLMSQLRDEDIFDIFPPLAGLNPVK